MNDRTTGISLVSSLGRGRRTAGGSPVVVMRDSHVVTSISLVGTSRVRPVVERDRAVNGSTGVDLGGNWGGWCGSVFGRNGSRVGRIGKVIMTTIGGFRGRQASRISSIAGDTGWD